MGIIHKPRLTMFWSKDSIIATPIFNQVLRRDRFLLLLRFLQFADITKYNPADPDRDKLYKLRLNLNMIKDRCCRVYSPGKCFSMDERPCAFQREAGLQAIHKFKESQIWYQTASNVYFKWHTFGLPCLPQKVLPQV